eukprot:GHVT01045069.1.p2 GENE.GHVT01045069.1~~GHVT01045069.1.p2  ORF type:complete len:122 (+),score=26.28 GHVT01045069.1:189-554(+)
MVAFALPPCLRRNASEHAATTGFKVVEDFSGHFIGTEMHQLPLIPHVFPNDCQGVMQVGQTFTIEPILCEGNPRLYGWQDGWTTATVDGGRCAQWEHTVLVTATGCDVLTRAPQEETPPRR